MKATLAFAVLVVMLFSSVFPQTIGAEPLKGDPIWQSPNRFWKLLASEDSRYSKTDNELRIQSGKLLVRTLSKPLNVHTPRSHITIQGDSLALITVNPESEDAFVVLGHADVAADGQHPILLNPGHESAVVNDIKIDLSYDQIGRRNRKARQLKNNDIWLNGEFSAFHLLNSDPLIKEVGSSKSPSDRKLVRRIEQTEQLQMTGGPFETLGQRAVTE